MASSSAAREASDSKRQAIYMELLSHWDGSKLPRGIIQNVAEKYGMHRASIGRYWKLGKNTSDTQNIIDTLKSKKKGRVGRKSIPLATINSALKAVPKRRRRSFRHASKVL